MATIQEMTALMDEMVQEKGWGSAGSKRQQTPRNLACSLSIEAAEVLELFQWSDELQDLDELGAELADVFLYLLQLANVSGIDLEQATRKKLKQNKLRTWN